MVSQTEVIWAYRALLGRDPENQSAIDYHIRHADFKDLCHTLITSEEGKAFHDKRVASLKNDLPFSVNKPVLILIHVAKTGGSALHHWLMRTYSNEGMRSAQIHNPKKLTIEEINQFDFISGHFSYSEAIAIPSINKTILTCLRNPAYRLISLYRFYRSHPFGTIGSNLIQLAHDLSVEDFFLHERVRTSNEVENCYLRTFSDYNGTNCGRHCSHSQFVEQAIIRVKSLDAVVITENMESSIETVAQALKLDSWLPPKRVHVTSNLRRETPGFEFVPEVKMSPHLAGILEPLISADIEIYHSAKALKRKPGHPH